MNYVDAVKIDTPDWFTFNSGITSILQESECERIYGDGLPAKALLLVNIPTLNIDWIKAKYLREEGKTA